MIDSGVGSDGARALGEALLSPNCHLKELKLWSECGRSLVFLLFLFVVEICRDMDIHPVVLVVAEVVGTHVPGPQLGKYFRCPGISSKK